MEVLAHDEMRVALSWGLMISGGVSPPASIVSTSTAPKQPSTKPKQAKKALAAVATADEDEFDVFGDDNGEEEETTSAVPALSRAEKAAALKKQKDAETEAAKQKALERLAKKEAKQRSLCNLEIKPWEAEQDLNELFKQIKEKVQPEGLKWSENCKLVEVAFGVKKMLLTAVLPMNLSMDAIIEDMTEEIFPNEIQSMNMTSMSLL